VGKYYNVQAATKTKRMFPPAGLCNIDGGLLFVTSEHPDMNVGFQQLLNRLRNLTGKKLHENYNDTFHF
jgi:hypothetical protein